MSSLERILAIAGNTVREAVPGSVYVLSGFDFTEHYFIVSADRRELIAIDAGRLSAGAFDSRMSALLAALAAEPGARLPGTRRLANRARAAAEGVTITSALHEEIRALIDRAA